MPATLDAQVEHQTSLTKSDQKRLERLAAQAGRTPQAMLRFVLRDGFASCEEDVAENIKADAEFVEEQGVDHSTLMGAAGQRIKAIAKRTRRAA